MATMAVALDRNLFQAYYSSNLKASGNAVGPERHVIAERYRLVM